MTRRFWLVLAVYLLATPPPWGSSATTIALSVRPRNCLARCSVRALIRIPRHADNRAFLLVWDAEGGMAGSSLCELEGADAPILHERILRDLTPGEYRVTVVLMGATGIRGRVETGVAVW